MGEEAVVEEAVVVVAEVEVAAEVVVAAVVVAAEVVGRWRRRRPCARQRPHVGAAASRPGRERRRAAVDLQVPDHRVRHPVLESEPGRRGCRDVVGVVDAPVGSGEDLLRNVRVDDDRVDGDVGQVAALVRPR